MMGTMILTIMSLASLGPDIIAFSEFTRRPQVSFEATTFRQDDLLYAAEGRRRPGANENYAPVEACDVLIADDALPFELRSWAVRQKMKLCTYSNDEWEALATGHDWVNTHGDEDPWAFEIRVVMGQIVSQRAHANFVPVYEDVRMVFDDLFEHHPQDTMLVVQAHVNFAHTMERLSLMDASLRLRGVKHCGIAVKILEEYIEGKDDNLSDRLRTRYERHVNEINVLAQRLLRSQSRTMTKQEYIKLWGRPRKQNSETSD